MSDVDIWRMKINRVDIVRILNLWSDVGFDVPSGQYPVFAIFFHGNSSHAILLFELRRENSPRDRKDCSKYGFVQNLEVCIIGSHL